MSMVPRAARFCPRPVQFVQGNSFRCGLRFACDGCPLLPSPVAIRSGWTRVDAWGCDSRAMRLGEELWPPLTDPGVFVILETRLLPLKPLSKDCSFHSRRLAAGTRRFKYGQRSLRQMAVQLRTKTRWSTRGQLERTFTGCDDPGHDTFPTFRPSVPFVSPTLSAAIVELRVAACFRARDELISTNID